VLAACGGGAGGGRPDTGAQPDAAPDRGPGGDDGPPRDAAGPDGGVDAAGDAGDAAGVGDAGATDGATDGGAADGPRTFVAVTFNTGIHPPVGPSGLTEQQSQYLNEYYSNGLAWGPPIAEARTFFDTVQPDVVTFQELFYREGCAAIPEEARQGFVCEGWTPGAPTVEQLILGPGYQVACNWGKEDKCAAVKVAFGTFRGCSSDTCLDGLYGSTISDCGSGGRIGRGVIDLVAGGTMTLVNVHGSSGQASADIDCRTQQVDQVFVDLGDGAPAASGAVSLVMGDFNTDPRSAVALVLDASARRWADFVGAGSSFHFVNDYVKTYPRDTRLFAIDNLVSNALSGSCWYPGFTAGHPAVSSAGTFDHTPVVCTITMP
jgi:hypothetical protein